MTDIRLGRIDYLNMAPMLWCLDAFTETLSGPPATVNEALLEGEIDLACISSIEWARNADELVLLPSLCVSAPGPAASVVVASPAALDRAAEIHITPESATSVALLKILLKGWQLEPTLVPLERDATDVLDGGEAVLLIGDAARALVDDPSTARYELTDLGDAWAKATSLPMVFAVWAMRRPIAEAHPGLAEQVDQQLVDAFARFVSTPGTLDAAAAQFGAERDAAYAYLSHFEYRFGDLQRESLLRFCDEARSIELLDEMPNLETLTPGRFAPAGAPS